MARRVKTLMERIRKNIALPEMKILPGQLAFFVILMLVPLIALILSIASNLHISDNMLDTIKTSQLPEMIISFIEYIDANDGLHVNTTIFFVSALILASNGPNSMIIASNQIYKLKSKGFLYDRVKSVFMLLVLILLVLFVIVVPVLGNYIIRWINVVVASENISSYISTIYSILNLPISWFFIFFSVKLLYTLAPDERIPSKNVNYGALFTSFGWILFTKLYSVYINVFSGYSTIYGGISGLLVLMWWIYFLMYIFVMGMALNVSKYEERKE